MRAVLQNYSSPIVCAIDDSFGFSTALLDVHADLFIAFVQSRQVQYLPATLLSMRLGSDGDDVNYAAPVLDTTSFYTIHGTSDPYEDGESVQIVAGSAVHVSSEADDMTNDVSARLEWRLVKLTVGVV